MHIRLLIIVLVQLLSVHAFAQKPESIIRDSIRLDSMKNALRHLNGVERINNLNEIASSFLGQSGLSGQRRSDSAFVYAQMAYNEAITAGNKYAQAKALINLATTKQYVQKITECAKYIRPALQLSLELKDDNLIGQSYYLLATVENTIENYKKALSYFQKTNNLLQQTEVTTWICLEYTDKGQYEDAFPYCEKCVALANATLKKDSSEWAHELVVWSYYNIGLLYKAAGDYETAIDYAYKAMNYAEAHYVNWKMFADISELYCIMNKPDSALVFWNLWKKDWNDYAKGHQAFGNNIRALIYIKNQQPDSALALLNTSLTVYNKMGKEAGGIPPIRTLLLQAEAFNLKKNYDRALSIAHEAIERAEKNNFRAEMRDGYQILSTAYHLLKNDRAAYENLMKYLAIKDSIENKQFLIRLNNYKREAEDARKEYRIGFLDRDNKIKRQQLKQEATFRNFILAAFSALVIGGLYIFRSVNLRRKNERLKLEHKEQEWKLKALETEKKHIELVSQSAQLEMQALRAQMNPHFIFNSLSSINHFILKNESKTASGYLTRFSRLIRMVLINSQKPLITLNDELEMLRIYLDMERLRLKNSFDYFIAFKNEVDAETMLVPPLLLQPFCENALWHGLMHKEGQGNLSIDISNSDGDLECVISDNGIGRKKSGEMNTTSGKKSKSMGIQITTQRLALLNRNKNVKTFYTIDDIVDEQQNVIGTKVILKIISERLAELV